MNQVDLDRVGQARRRLRSASSSPHHDDLAIRVVELTSPNPAGEDLELNRNFTVISGLSEPARRALADTIDGLRLDDPGRGLVGIIEDHGARFPLHAVGRGPEVPGTSLIPARPFSFTSAPRTAEAAQLAEIIETIDRAVLLSGAELRGADAAAEAIRQEIIESRGSSIELVGPEVDEARRTLAALDEVAPPAEVIEHIEKVLRAVEANPERVALRARRSQAEGARGQVLPGDSRNFAMLADLAIAEADGELAEFDMRSQSEASLLAASLALLNIEVSPAAAPETAAKVLEECAELDSIRQRALQTIADEASAPAAQPQALTEQLQRIADQQAHIQRRLRSQQQMLAIAREQWSIYGIGEIDLRTHLDFSAGSSRPLPILVEEPLADLPMRLSGAILSMLLRHSATTQVICISDLPDLRNWCQAVGVRAGWVAATGWFAEETT